MHIVLKGGTYPLPTPLLLTPYDGGTADSPTTIEGAAGEHAVISGGVVLSGWHKAEHVEALSAVADGHVWESDAPVFCGRPLRFRQLWVNGNKAVRARTPNGDTYERLVSWDRKNQVAGIPAALAATVHDPLGVEMILQQQWEIATLRVKSVRVEGEKGLVTFQQPESKLEFEHPWPQPILPPKGGGAFFLANAVEFLDSPGEWYQDPKSGQVLYWPRAGEDMSSVDTVLALQLRDAGDGHRDGRPAGCAPDVQEYFVCIYHVDAAFTARGRADPGRRRHADDGLRYKIKPSRDCRTIQKAGQPELDQQAAGGGDCDWGQRDSVRAVPV